MSAASRSSRAGRRSLDRDALSLACAGSILVHALLLAIVVGTERPTVSVRRPSDPWSVAVELVHVAGGAPSRTAIAALPSALPGPLRVDAPTVQAAAPVPLRRRSLIPSQRAERADLPREDPTQRPSAPVEGTEMPRTAPSSLGESSSAEPTALESSSAESTSAASELDTSSREAEPTPDAPEAHPMPTEPPASRGPTADRCGDAFNGVWQGTGRWESWLRVLVTLQITRRDDQLDVRMTYRHLTSHVQPHDCHDGVDFTVDVHLQGVVSATTASIRSLRGSDAAIHERCSHVAIGPSLWTRTGAFSATITLNGHDAGLADLAPPAEWNWHVRFPLRRVACEGSGPTPGR